MIYGETHSISNVHSWQPTAAFWKFTVTRTNCNATASGFRRSRQAALYEHSRWDGDSSLHQQQAVYPADPFPKRHEGAPRRLRITLQAITARRDQPSRGRRLIAGYGLRVGTLPGTPRLSGCDWAPGRFAPRSWRALLSPEAFFFVGALSDARRFKVCNCSSFKSRSFVAALPVPARPHPHSRPIVSVHLIRVIVLSIGPILEAHNTRGSMPLRASMLQTQQ